MKDPIYYCIHCNKRGPAHMWRPVRIQVFSGFRNVLKNLVTLGCPQCDDAVFRVFNKKKKQ
jgi:hypothetical protein